MTEARAAVYCRISRDPEGIRAGVERQQEDCHALADRHKLNVVATYVDNDVSASTLSRKKRPQYEAMLEAARRGEFDVIVAYSNSRLTRRLLELEGLIRLHEEHKTRIVTVVSGEDNLSTADGRMVARIKASVDAAESERLGERSRRAHLQRAKNGDANKGGRAFGWNEDKMTLNPREAQLIRDAANQILDGIALRTIAREWTAQSVCTSRGLTWTHTTLRRALQRPRLIGVQTYHGDVLKDASGEPTKGNWEPLLDLDTYDRLQVTLKRNARGGARRGARRYLLTGVVRCGVCGQRMVGMKTPTGHAYTCQPEPATHSVTITGPQTEDAIVRVATARLAKENLEEVPASTPAAIADGRLDQIPQLITELMTAYSSGQLSGSIVFPQIEALEAERATLKVERSSYIAATAIPTKPSAADFDKLDTDRQRAVLESLFDAIVVAPASRRGEPWSINRLAFIWRSHDQA